MATMIIIAVMIVMINAIITFKIVLAACLDTLNRIEETENAYIKKLYEITDEAVKQASSQNKKR